MVDTCQANTLYSKFYSPNILATGSSELDENSYSVCFYDMPLDYLALNLLTSKHEPDYDIGVAVIDSYTHYVLQYLEGINKTSKATMEEFVGYHLPIFVPASFTCNNSLQCTIQ